MSSSASNSQPPQKYDPEFATLGLLIGKRLGKKTEDPTVILSLLKAYALSIKGKNRSALEHDTARYVMILLPIFFPLGDWNLLPQYYTKKGVPDIVMETYTKDKEEFTKKIYIEFKGNHGDNVLSALKQVEKAVSTEQGENYLPQGFLIVVRGGKWLFMEYNFGVTPPGTKTEFTSYPLTATKKGFPHTGTPAFPILGGKLVEVWNNTKEHLENYILDFSKDLNIIVSILDWLSLSRGKNVRKWMHPSPGAFALPSAGPTLASVFSGTYPTGHMEDTLEKLKKFTEYSDWVIFFEGMQDQNEAASTQESEDAQGVAAEEEEEEGLEWTEYQGSEEEGSEWTEYQGSEEEESEYQGSEEEGSEYEWST